jgi:hypothetical protein
MEVERLSRGGGEPLQRNVTMWRSAVALRRSLLRRRSERYVASPGCPSSGHRGFRIYGQCAWVLAAARYTATVHTKCTQGGLKPYAGRAGCFGFAEVPQGEAESQHSMHLLWFPPYQL